MFPTIPAARADCSPHAARLEKSQQLLHLLALEKDEIH